MNSIDLTPLYRGGISFDRLASLIDNALILAATGSNYPDYDIEELDDNEFAINLAAPGFEKQELSIEVEAQVLTVRGERKEAGNRNYLHRGIANGSFECKFNLEKHIEVSDAEFHNGLLTVRLVKEVPEAMKPRTIEINTGKTLEHSRDSADKKRLKAA